MRYRTALASLIAGFITPLPLLVLLNGNQSHFALAAAFFATLSVALWPRISPAFFGSAVIIAAPVWYSVLAPDRASARFALGLTMIAIAGVIVSVATGLIATLLRYWPMPWWAPLVPLAVAALLLAVSRQDHAAATNLLRDIATGEVEYAAASPGHAYTCEARISAVFR